MCQSPFLLPPEGLVDLSPEMEVQLPTCQPFTSVDTSIGVSVGTSVGMFVWLAFPLCYIVVLLGAYMTDLSLLLRCCTSWCGAESLHLVFVLLVLGAVYGSPSPVGKCHYLQSTLFTYHPLLIDFHLQREWHQLRSPFVAPALGLLYEGILGPSLRSAKFASLSHKLFQIMIPIRKDPDPHRM